MTHYLHGECLLKVWKRKYILSSFNTVDYFCVNIHSSFIRFERFIQDHHQKWTVQIRLYLIFHLALSTCALSRGSWTRILRFVRKSSKTECQDLFHESIRQGSKIDRDLRLSYQRKVILRIYTHRYVRRLLFRFTSHPDWIWHSCEYFPEINSK